MCVCVCVCKIDTQTFSFMFNLFEIRVLFIKKSPSIDEKTKKILTLALTCLIVLIDCICFD